MLPVPSFSKLAPLGVDSQISTLSHLITVHLYQHPVSANPFQNQGLFHPTLAQFQPAISVRSCGISSGLPAHTAPAH